MPVPRVFLKESSLIFLSYLTKISVTKISGDVLLIYLLRGSSARDGDGSTDFWRFKYELEIGNCYNTIKLVCNATHKVFLVMLQQKLMDDRLYAWHCI